MMRRSLLLIPAFALLGRAANHRARPGGLASSASRTIELPAEICALSHRFAARQGAGLRRSRAGGPRQRRSGRAISLVELTAPEMQAQIAEAESRLQAAEADQLQAEAQLAAAQSTYQRTAEAAKTPGAVAGNDLVLAQKQVDAAQALVNSRQKASAAAAIGGECPPGYAGVLEDHRAFRWRGHRPPRASGRPGRSGRRGSRAARRATGFAFALGSARFPRKLWAASCRAPESNSAFLHFRARRFRASSRASLMPSTRRPAPCPWNWTS